MFGSGPTGPINTTTHQFLGRSDQNLKFFVVDLQNGTLAATIDTGIANAFSGPLLGSSIDIDRAAPSVAGNYQDDAVYVGFTKKDTSSGEWIQGGFGRLVTKENADPTQWAWSVVLDNIGPVTTTIGRLQDKRAISKNLWLYFGTGRYFYKDPLALDDNDSRRALYGVKEPCYNTLTTPGNFLDKTCTAAQAGTIVDQTSSIAAVADTDRRLENQPGCQNSDRGGGAGGYRYGSPAQRHGLFHLVQADHGSLRLWWQLLPLGGKVRHRR